MNVDEDQAQGGLFDVPELACLPNARRTEAGLEAALQAAVRDKLVRDVDAGLIGAALVAARALDEAETIRSPKDRAYAVTALLPPYQKALHGLGLPLDPTGVGASRVPAAGPEPAGAPSWLGDEFGPQ